MTAIKTFVKADAMRPTPESSPQVTFDLNAMRELAALILNQEPYYGAWSIVQVAGFDADGNPEWPWRVKISFDPSAHLLRGVAPDADTGKVAGIVVEGATMDEAFGLMRLKIRKEVLLLRSRADQAHPLVAALLADDAT